MLENQGDVRISRRILVIDDEPLILKTVERALSKSGYSVVTAGTVNAFLDEISRGGFDLYIVDMHIKGEAPGSAVSRIRELNENSRILIISGSVRMVPEGDYLQKPFRIEDLRLKVEELLNEP